MPNKEESIAIKPSKLMVLKNLMQTPYDLLRKLTDYDIVYGWWDKVNQRRITPDMEEYKLLDEEEYFNKHISVLLPYQVWKYKTGVCWDTALLLWYSISKMKKIEAYVYYLEGFDESSHSACYYNDSTGWYWIEYSWYINRGIHGPFKDKKELFSHLNNVLSFSSYFHNIKVFNSNVNFLPIYKSDEISVQNFLDCCYKNASFYTLDDQDSDLVKDNEQGQLTPYSIPK